MLATREAVEPRCEPAAAGDCATGAPTASDDVAPDAIAGEAATPVVAAMGPALAASMAAEIWRATTAADFGRRAASDDNSLAIKAWSDGGISGNAGTPAAILSLSASPVGAVKGGLPVKRKKIRAPIEYRSDAGVAAVPESCSGAAKNHRLIKASLRGRTASARPQSRKNTSPSGDTSTLPGVNPPWTRGACVRACRGAKRSAIFCASRPTRRGSMSPRGAAWLRNCARSTPALNSHAA